MLKALGDPHLVAKFQSLCGLREKSREEHAANGGGLCNGHAQNGHVSNGYVAKESPPNRQHNSVIPNGVNHRNGFVQRHENSHSPNKSQPDHNKAVALDYNPVVHAVFFFGSALGNESFYLTFFPFLFWILDAYLARRLALLWAIVMYIGQCAKDIIQWPRPPTPPVIWVEKRYQWEYGMPSTHAMVGLLIPFTLVYFSYDRYQYPLTYAVLFVVAWCVLVSASRMYLGMHTLQDIVAGILFSLIILLILVPHLDDKTEKMVLTSPNAPIFFIVVPVILIVIYPLPPQHTLTRADTAMVISGASGALLGCWIKYQSMEIPDPYAGVPYIISLPDAPRVVEMLTRFIVGSVEVASVRMCVKTIVLSTLPYVLPIPDPKLRQTTTELCHRYMTYMIVGCVATYVVPRTFVFFNI